MKEPLLEITDLDLRVAGSEQTGGPNLVEGVNLRVDEASITAVVGESGSGKTLTALASIGLLPPAIEMVHGSIRLAGQDCEQQTQKAWRSMRGRVVSMVFQEPMTALDPVFTVGELMLETLSLDGVSRRDAREQALALLEEVRVPEPVRCMSSVPHQLSGGMRQRVVIALALARNPRLLLADEPTTALDAITQEAVMDLFDQLRSSRGLGILLITHDLSLVAHRVQQLVVLHGGRMCEAGASDLVMRNPRHPYTRGLLACRLPVVSREEPLKQMAAVLDDPASWEVVQSQEGPVKPWWPSLVGANPSSPRLVSVDTDHFLAV
ncbi:MAG: ABC transporter ATP-binding protein [Phycisphaerales bacterium]|nr:ABC transporter ATP-binding protein [Phycisphaerales bacterium]